LRIADNVAKDVLRDGWQKARQLEVAAEQAWLESFPSAPRALPDHDQMADPVLVKALREIVSALPEAQRRIVWADALNPDGPVASEVLGEELGIPPGTVRVYRKRGLDRIRKEMEKRDLKPEQR
jgi:DNA-directed RNA polymerase specialized sigma24 family protein